MDLPDLPLRVAIPQAEGETTEVNLIAARAGWLKVACQTRAGAPLTGHRVRIAPVGSLDRDRPRGVRHVFTDERGEALLQTPAGEYEVGLGRRPEASERTRVRVAVGGVSETILAR